MREGGFTRLTKKYVKVDVAVTNADGQPVTPSAVQAALTPRAASVDAGTESTTYPMTDSEAAIFVAGPDADPSNGLVLHEHGAQLWIPSSDDPEASVATSG